MITPGRAPVIAFLQVSQETIMKKHADDRPASYREVITAGRRGAAQVHRTALRRGADPAEVAAITDAQALARGAEFSKAVICR